MHSICHKVHAQMHFSLHQKVIEEKISESTNTKLNQFISKFMIAHLFIYFNFIFEIQKQKEIKRPKWRMTLEKHIIQKIINRHLNFKHGNY